MQPLFLRFVLCRGRLPEVRLNAENRNVAAAQLRDFTGAHAGKEIDQIGPEAAAAIRIIRAFIGTPADTECFCKV